MSTYENMAIELNCLCEELDRIGKQHTRWCGEYYMGIHIDPNENEIRDTIENILNRMGEIEDVLNEASLEEQEELFDNDVFVSGFKSNPYADSCREGVQRFWDFLETLDDVMEDYRLEIKR